MPRPDTGNFNRLLTSLGLLLLAASLAIPYFYFQSTDTLRIPTKELQGLTKTARSTIEGRQTAIAHLEVWVAVGSVAVGLGGVVLLVVGGRRLRLAQESEEEEGELRKSRTRAEIQGMSPEQVEDKRDEQAREAISVGAPEPAADALSASKPTAVRQPTEGRETPKHDADRRYRERREIIARIEEEVVGVLSTAKFKTHEFLPNVSVTSAQAPVGVKLDGLFEALVSTQKDVVLEIKLFDSRSFGNVASTYAQELIANVARYQVLSERPSVGWLLAVIPNTQSRDLKVARVQVTLNRDIKPFGFSLAIDEAEITSLPARFISMIELGEAKAS